MPHEPWEYVTETHPLWGADRPLQAILASRGEEGWELITVIAVLNNGGEHMRLFFKRRAFGPVFQVLTSNLD
jgi:hypothetical protein